MLSRVASEVWHAWSCILHLCGCHYLIPKILAQALRGIQVHLSSAENIRQFLLHVIKLKKPTLAPGSNSTRTSTSLSARKSSRSTDPNNASFLIRFLRQKSAILSPDNIMRLAISISSALRFHALDQPLAALAPPTRLYCIIRKLSWVFSLSNKCHDAGLADGALTRSMQSPFLPNDEARKATGLPRGHILGAESPKHCPTAVASMLQRLPETLFLWEEL